MLCLLFSSASAELYSAVEKVVGHFTAITGVSLHVSCTSFVEVVQIYLSLLEKKKLNLSKECSCFRSTLQASYFGMHGSDSPLQGCDGVLNNF